MSETTNVTADASDFDAYAILELEQGKLADADARQTRTIADSPSSHPDKNGARHAV